MNPSETTGMMNRGSLWRGFAGKIKQSRRREEHLHNEMYPLKVGEKYLISAKVQTGLANRLLPNGIYTIQEVKYFEGIGFGTQFRVSGKKGVYVKKWYNFKREI